MLVENETDVTVTVCGICETNINNVGIIVCDICDANCHTECTTLIASTVYCLGCAASLNQANVQSTCQPVDSTSTDDNSGNSTIATDVVHCPILSPAKHGGENGHSGIPDKSALAGTSSSVQQV